MCKWKEIKNGVYENEKGVCCYDCIRNSESDDCEFCCLYMKKELNKMTIECDECKHE